MNAKKDAKWKEIQQRTFTNWVNEELNGTGYYAKDIEIDFKDGLMLMELLKALSMTRYAGKVEKYDTLRKKPSKIKSHAQVMENLTLCFDFMKSNKIKLVNIGKLYYDIV